jgi:hypothetical protein
MSETRPKREKQCIFAGFTDVGRVSAASGMPGGDDPILAIDIGMDRDIRKTRRLKKRRDRAALVMADLHHQAAAGVRCEGAPAAIAR